MTSKRGIKIYKGNLHSLSLGITISSIDLSLRAFNWDQLFSRRKISLIQPSFVSSTMMRYQSRRTILQLLQGSLKTMRLMASFAARWQIGWFRSQVPTNLPIRPISMGFNSWTDILKAKLNLYQPQSSILLEWFAC